MEQPAQKCVGERLDQISRGGRLSAGEVIPPNSPITPCLRLGQSAGHRLLHERAAQRVSNLMREKE